ncbi:condensation domain-containing protein, partial [Pseudomonas alabamensis]|uniref:condensation domain-containing protein n=1 Tax=Pseudomonas alabamensis TaxID=3064349 RepID=UPI003F64FDB9
LARGYLKRADLSATRFVPDPFSNSGERLYRTGDLARYRQDGIIEYVGRIDHQVKIRGFRIELGEIEARLTQQPAVREAVVLAVDGPSGQQLVGYVIAHRQPDDQSALRDELKAGLKAHLPDYMVPAHLLFLAQWPLTANGKLDRRALPAPDASLLQQGYVAPATERERQLAAIWAQVLELDQIGRDDHFFELGGHSLLATQVIARVRQTLELDAGLRHLFEAPTLAGFAASLEALDASKARPLPALVAHGEQAEAPLSLAQRRLWVVEQFASPSGAYGMPLALRVEGELSVPLLQASLAQLIQRHEVLRSAYVADDDGDPLACVTREITLDLPVLDLSGLSAGEREGRVAEAIEANARQPISLLRAPLLRGQVLRLGEHSHVLLFCMHHIISDGWSMALLGNEVVEVYGRLLAGNHTPLPALAVQYSDYARWQLELGCVGVLDAQAAWWRDALVGHDGLLRLPTDQPRQAKASQVGRDLGFTLPQALHQALKALSRDAGVTLYSTLLAGFQLMLHRLSGSDDVLVGADVAGRAQPELEALIGFFINVLPLRSRWQPDLSLRQYLAQVQSTALGAFEHQDLPFDQIVDAVGAPRHKGANPLVQVLFVMNNLPVQPSGFAQLQVEAIPSAGGFSKFDMALFIDEEHGQLHGTWQYASDLFQQERIERCVKAWMTILEQMVSDPDQPLGDIDMPTNTAAQVAAPATPASSKADKLGKFLKKAPGASARPASAAMRESLIVPGQVFPALWEPTDPGLDLVQWIASNRALVEEKLGTHAGILFRGFAIRDIHDFEAFAEAVQPGLYGKYGDLPKKEGGKNTYRSTPYPEKKMILFHNESSHQDRWPRKQMFYCEQPSPIGGATPVVDCRLMYQRLPDALRETFERKGLLYVRTFADKLDVSWQHFFKTEARTEVEARCRAAGIQWTWLDNDELQIRTPCPAIIRHPVTGEKSFFNQVQLHHNHCLDPDVREDLLAMFGEQRMPRHVYYGDGSPIEDEVMQLIGELYEACAVRFDWQKGDVILLDNMLAAHARDPFEGPRKIVVAMGDMIERSALEALYPTLQKDGAGA